MRQPLYKRLLSYIFDIPIESLQSDHNDSLDLVLSHGRYQLLTQGAIYSYEDKYDNFRLSFEKINLNNHDIQNVLLLGLGMASIPVILERIFNRAYAYTGIEVDDAVVYLASKYIINDLNSNVEIFETDAYIFMLQNTSKYDMICMDVFIDDKIPTPFQSLEFLNLLKNALNDNGILLFNWLAVTPDDIVKVEQYFEHKFLKVFPNSQSIILDNNRMLVNIKS